MFKNHQQFKATIPMFHHLPDEVYNSLDLSHFYFPNEMVSRMRNDLEKMLGHYVVTYNTNVFRLDIPIETHLCAIAQGANLTQPQLELLKKFETILKPIGVTLVVFQKPLTLIPVEQSALYKKYKKLNLL